MEIVVLDRTGNLVRNKRVVGGIYHGHVRDWDALDLDMQNALINSHMVDKRGCVYLDPTYWEP
jgi:hypothetical protein